MYFPINQRILLYAILFLSFNEGVHAETASELEEQSIEVDLEQEKFRACMFEQVSSAKNRQTMGELRALCKNTGTGLIESRRTLESAVGGNPFAIQPYRPNYILPFTYSNVNENPYQNVLQGDSYDNVEAKFQISFKYKFASNVLVNDLDLQVAFTTVSWWQSYNYEISAPFRETNYEPELILNYDRSWSLFGLPVKNTFLSLTHESNGRGGELSRSWNRVIGGLSFDQGNFIWGASAWWRIPESKKDGPGEARGDDNPDILAFLGYGELNAVWKLPRNHNLEIKVRNNLRRNNKGALELGWSFPLSKRLRGFVQYFNGYGDGLIYYNESVERIGIGVKLTDWL